jgi:hypothetical protein
MQMWLRLPANREAGAVQIDRRNARYRIAVTRRRALDVDAAFRQDVEVDDEGGLASAGSPSQDDCQSSLISVAAERLHSSRAGSVDNLLTSLQCAGFSALG